MEDFTSMSQEEIEKALEKAKQEMQERLAQMTPEERQAAIANAKEAIEADKAESQKMIDDAMRLLNGSYLEKTQNYCPNCGAPAEGGNFCQFCGSPLNN